VIFVFVFAGHGRRATGYGLQADSQSALASASPFWL
jgi:hypothetical protein